MAAPRYERVFREGRGFKGVGDYGSVWDRNTGAQMRLARPDSLTMSAATGEAASSSLAGNRNLPGAVLEQLISKSKRSNLRSAQSR